MKPVTPMERDAAKAARTSRLRDEFAMAALPSALTHFKLSEKTVGEQAATIARGCYLVADAMIAEREKRK